jgi:hypothetical protein
MNEIRLYSNKQNSCFIDSLLAILFLSGRGYYISRLIRTDIESIQYEKGVCSQYSRVRDVTNYALRVQQLLKNMFFDVDRKTHSIHLIRALSRCDARLKSGAMGNPAEIFDLLCGLFPSLKIRYRRKESDGIFTREQSLFDMTDLPTLSEMIKNTPPFLTFSNGGIERPTKGLINWAKKGFDMTIINNTYTLVGAIVHVLQSHYVAYFSVDGQWFHYDDLSSPNASPIDTLPKIFHDTRTLQPAMLFYKK